MFSSFFLAGFECSCGPTLHGGWFDEIKVSEHDRRLTEDYVALRNIGIHAAREGIRWPLVDRKGRYDFSSVAPVVRVSRAFNFSVIWDLFHFGYPAELDPFSDSFRERFAYYCYAVGSYLSREVPGQIFVTVVNEPSFFSYAGGDRGQIAPFAKGRGWELKVCTARAAIEGVNAFRAAVPNAVFVSVDPICRMVAPCDRPDLEPFIRRFNSQVVFESLDMLSGKLLPELGGSRDHLGIVGINYYPVNQWEWGREMQPLAYEDPRRVSFTEIVDAVGKRYGGRVMITETGGVAHERAPWINYVSSTVRELRKRGVELSGICLYPIMNLRLLGEQGRCGLWDLGEDGCRIPVRDAIAALREAQEDLGVRPAMRMDGPRQDLREGSTS